MRLFMAAFALLSSFVAQAQSTQFTSRVDQAPVRFQIVRSDDCASGSCFFYDSSGQKRLTVFHAGGYQLVNSRGIEIGTKVPSTPQESRFNERLLTMATSACPVDVAFSRETLRILFVAPTCKPPTGLATMTITSRDACNSGSCFLYKSGSSQTAIVYNTNGTGYQIKLSRYDITVGVTPLEDAQFMSFIKNVSPTCPLKVDYRIETGKILKMALGCDPLASTPGVDAGSASGF